MAHITHTHQTLSEPGPVGHAMGLRAGCQKSKHPAGGAGFGSLVGPGGSSPPLFRTPRPVLVCVGGAGRGGIFGHLGRLPVTG